MGKIISIYGLPAAGKTTQAELLFKKYGLYQFGMGDKLRAEINANTALGQKAKEMVSKGFLVPDEVIRGILQNVKKQAQETGIVFDGFPRMIPQAELLEEMLGEINLEVDLFILLRISSEEAARRISDRSESGGRADDKDPKVVNSRMEVFRKESLPLIDHYTKLGKFVEIDGEKSISEVFAEIENHL